MNFKRQLIGFVPMLLLLSLVLPGCAGNSKPGAVITRFDSPGRAELVSVSSDGDYGCYQEGKPEPLEVATLKKGQKLGFEIVSPDEGRGLTTPKLVGIGGDKRFMLPLGERYAWKRM